MRSTQIKQSHTDEDDAACMMAIAAGSTRAFQAVMDSYTRDVFRFSFSMLGDASKAEDATQETFMRLWSYGSEWKPTGRLKSWLFKIAHNLCIDEIRRTRGHMNVDDMADVLPDQAPTPRQNVSTVESAAIVRSALFQLPERQRAALMLVHYSDRTNIEAADIMDISVDALESLLSRGRKSLKIFLADHKDSLLGE